MSDWIQVKFNLPYKEQIRLSRKELIAICSAMATAKIVEKIFARYTKWYKNGCDDQKSKLSKQKQTNQCHGLHIDT